MLITRKYIVLLGLFFLTVSSPCAESISPVDEGSVSVVSAEDLSKTLGKVLVIDARSKSAFRAGHVPGSRHMDWRDWTVSNKDSAPAEPNAALEERLREFGLSNDHFIVIIGEPGTGDEGRVAWNLLYWGANRVTLLDGGYPAWRLNINPVERGTPRPMVRGNFLARGREERRAKPDDGAMYIPLAALYRENGLFAGRDDLDAMAAPCSAAAGGVSNAGALFSMLVEARLGRMLKAYVGN